MKKPSRREIFEQASRLLRASFEETMANVPHAASKGSEGEEILRKFLNDHLPKRFSAGAGFVIDSTDAISPQTDVILYDALNCPVYRASPTASIFPNDNVSAVIEVKSQLDKARLAEAHGNVSRAKALRKSEPQDLPFLVSFETQGFLFAFKSSIRLDKIAEHYLSLLRGEGRLGTHIDLIVVLDVGVVGLYVVPPGQQKWSPSMMFGPGGKDAEGTHIAVGYAATGADTLDYFLRVLLVHLQHFRGVVDHPGFDWSKMTGGGQVQLTYLATTCFEKDPKKRDEKKKIYREEARGLMQ